MVGEVFLKQLNYKTYNTMCTVDTEQMANGNKKAFLNTIEVLLNDNGFYWVRYKEDTEWEVAKWDKMTKRFKFISGMRCSIFNLYEADTRQLINQNK